MNKQRKTPISRNVAATESNRTFFGDAPVSSSESLSLDEPSPFYFMMKKLKDIANQRAEWIWWIIKKCTANRWILSKVNRSPSIFDKRLSWLCCSKLASACKMWIDTYNFINWRERIEINRKFDAYRIKWGFRLAIWNSKNDDTFFLKAWRFLGNGFRKGAILWWWNPSILFS